jgi:hypothetical protein
MGLNEILDFRRRGKPTDNATIESFNERFRERLRSNRHRPDELSPFLRSAVSITVTNAAPHKHRIAQWSRREPSIAIARARGQPASLIQAV